MKTAANLQMRMKGKSKVSANDALNIAKGVSIPAVIISRWAVAFSVSSLVVSLLTLFYVVFTR